MSASDPRFGEPLTVREIDILRLVADGLSNPDIGRRLFLAENTVKTYLRTASVRLGACDRTNALWLACVSGQLVPRPGADPLPPPPAPCGVSPEALELLLALAEQVAAGRPVPAVRRSAVEALTAAGRRSPGGRPVASARRRVSP